MRTNLYNYNHAASTVTTSRRCCETFVDEACDHGAIESVGKDESFPRDAAWKAREYRQRMALLLAQAWFS